MNPLTFPHIQDTMRNTFGGPKIFGIEISKARPATSSSASEPPFLLYEPSLDEGSIYAGPSAQDPSLSSPEDDEPLVEPPRKSKDLEHFLGLPMRNITTAAEEVPFQRSAAVRNTGREGKPGRSKRYGRWMMSRTRMAAKKEQWVSRAKKMMQQNVLRRHSFGNQI